MDYNKLWKISVCFTIALHCLASSVAQVDECSPRCWNPVQPNSCVTGGIEQRGVANEEECKTLCINNGTCIGVDWDIGSNSCWFQMEQGTITNQLNRPINHWSLANCTDDCVSYCWRPVQIGFYVSGGSHQSDITDENHCKLRCSNTSSCTGIDWDSQCWLIFTGYPPTPGAQVHHWDIKRNFPTSCPTNSTQYSTYTSTSVNRSTVSGNASPTVSITSNTVAPLQSSTNPLEERSTGCSDNLTSGIIVLAVLLGLCVFIIIGLVINTIRIGRLPHQKSDNKSVELCDNNYQGLQRADTKARSEDGTYTDLVQVNPNESAYEQTA